MVEEGGVFEKGLVGLADLTGSSTSPFRVASDAFNPRSGSGAVPAHQESGHDPADKDRADRHDRYPAQGAAEVVQRGRAGGGVGQRTTAVGSKLCQP